VSAAGQPRVRRVRSFEELRSTRFADGVNALYWERTLPGDFTEVIAKLGPGEGIVPLDDERIRALELSSAGRLAAEAMLADQQLLRDHDLAPCVATTPAARSGPSGAPHQVPPGRMGLMTRSHAPDLSPFPLETT
jgi:hypothetical protein